MFEKESEEYADKYENNRGSLEWWSLRNSYQVGAAFGYDKAIKDLETANEWHFVKDGKCPTHSYRVLVFTDEGVGFGIYGLDDKKWHTYDTGFEVIAWKEITLPELPEEIEQ